MHPDLPKDWDLIRQKILRYPSIYSESERLIELLEFCASSPILKALILDLSLSRLLFCRYLGDTGYPCVYAKENKYVVSSFIGNEKYFFIELERLVSFVEACIGEIDKEAWVHKGLICLE